MSMLTYPRHRGRLVCGGKFSTCRCFAGKLKTCRDTPQLVSLVILLLAGPVAFAASQSADEAFFELKIRPVLAGTCARCHGSKKTSGGLRLDSQAAFLKGGNSGRVV